MSIDQRSWAVVNVTLSALNNSGRLLGNSLDAIGLKISLVIQRSKLSFNSKTLVWTLKHKLTHKRKNFATKRKVGEKLTTKNVRYREKLTFEKDWLIDWWKIRCHWPWRESAIDARSRVHYWVPCTPSSKLQVCCFLLSLIILEGGGEFFNTVFRFCLEGQWTTRIRSVVGFSAGCV